VNPPFQILPVTDRELLDLLRQSDHGAFDTIFRAFYAPLVGLAERMLRQRETAEEIVQDVLLEVWRRRGDLVVEESLRAYLYRATRNRVLNHIRHGEVVQRTARMLRDEQVPQRTAVADVMESEIDEAVREAVGALPDRCREVFELSRQHGLKYAEIAVTLGISVKTVEAQMGKALRVLREKLAVWLP
jgi:RNA polymerase sigma-70 factor (ECF subfamily)